MTNKPKFSKSLILAASVLAAGIISAPVALAGAQDKTSAKQQAFYSQSSQKEFTGPEKNFTGKVSVKTLFPPNETAHYSGAYVTFQPGARTAWHSHPTGQHIIVTSGSALTGTRDGHIIEVAEGESVWCPPNTDHWHGAAGDKPMTHLVITGNKDGNNVVWKEKVSDEQIKQVNN